MWCIQDPLSLQESWDLAQGQRELGTVLRGRWKCHYTTSLPTPPIRYPNRENVLDYILELISAPFPLSGWICCLCSLEMAFLVQLGSYRITIWCSESTPMLNQTFLQLSLLPEQDIQTRYSLCFTHSNQLFLGQGLSLNHSIVQLTILLPWNHVIGYLGEFARLVKVGILNWRHKTPPKKCHQQTRLWDFGDNIFCTATISQS